MNFNKPITFANTYLRENVFRSKETKSYSIFVTLVVMMFAYVALLGLFLFGLITSLSGVAIFQLTQSRIVDNGCYFNNHWGDFINVS